MSTELSALPESFAAGTTVTYSKSFADYPASDGWSLTLYLAGATIASVVADADGDAFDLTIPAATTVHPFLPGLYRWSERVSKAGEVREVGSGVVDIEPNLAEATDGSLQSFFEEAIPILQAHIRGRLTAGLQSYSIGGRAVSKIPIGEATKLLESFEASLRRLKNPGRVSRGGLFQIVKAGSTQ